MSWLSRLFAGGASAASAGAPSSGPAEEYKGFTIRAALMPAGSEFQLAGAIEKDVAGTMQRHEFVRADRFSSRSEAESATLSKARQIIDEQGEKMFQQNWPARTGG